MKGIFKSALLICMFFLPTLLRAQPYPPTFDGESPFGVTDVPFDDGVFLLVGVAIVYGVLKIRAYNKAERNKKMLWNN